MLGLEAIGQIAMASPQTCQSKRAVLESCRSCSGPWPTPNLNLCDNFVILLLSISIWIVINPPNATLYRVVRVQRQYIMTVVLLRVPQNGLNVAHALCTTDAGMIPALRTH